MKTMHRTFTTALVILALLTSSALANLQLASVFSDDMILQQNMPVPVWGIADPGETVTVSYAGQSRSTQASAEGLWRVDLDPMQGSYKAHDLIVSTISPDAKPIHITGIAVGEVWIVLGNSFPRMYTTDCPVPYPEDRVLRLDNSTDIRFSNAPQSCYGQDKWYTWGGKKPTDHDVLTLHFIDQLHQALDVPVGIIRIWVDNIDAVTPVEGIGSVPALDDIAQRVEAWYPQTKRGKVAADEWLAKSKEWTTEIKKHLYSDGYVGPSQPPFVPGPVLGDRSEPTVVFNGMLAPLVPMAVRGIVHTHETANATDELYTAKMTALIQGLRSVWKRPDLPFCFIQQESPAIRYAEMLDADTGVDRNAWAWHRDRQRLVLGDNENVGLVVTLDTDAFPGDTGQRMAQWALADVYEQRNTAATGPIYREHSVSHGKVTIQFDSIDKGLMVATKAAGRPPLEVNKTTVKFLAVAGKDRIWRSAHSKLEKDQLLVWSDKVKQPVAVRYAFDSEPRGLNLYNKAGLPATPFRSDDWATVNMDDVLESCKTKTPNELVALLGYPGAPTSRAAAKALAEHGNQARPLIESLLADKDPDIRCGALRALAYLNWVGPFNLKGYMGKTSQPATPAIEQTIQHLQKMASDKNYWVRYCVAEAAGLIRHINSDIVETMKTLATDRDAFVRCAALRVTKLCIADNDADGCMAIANTFLKNVPTADHASLDWVGELYTRYYRYSEMNWELVGSFLQNRDVGQCSRFIGRVGSAAQRTGALYSDQMMPAVLHLYSLGCREYILYGIDRNINKEECLPAIRAKIENLEQDIAELKRTKPKGWLDRARRYEHAVVDLRRHVEEIEKSQTR